MKVKKIKIGIKSMGAVFKDVEQTVGRIEKGERLKPVREPQVYFESLEVFRRAFTPKRMDLLHIIKTQKPSSIHELARMAERDIKNVADDVKYLEKIGLIEIKEDKRKTAPIIRYDQIALEIAV